MSDAEIVAYLWGWTIASEAAAAIDAGTVVDELPDDPMPVRVGLAMARLGQRKFTYWVLRGSREAVEADA